MNEAVDKNNKITTKLMYSLIYGAVCALASTIAPIIIVAVIFIPVPLIFCGVKFGRPYALFGLLAGCIVSYFLGGFTSMLLFATAFLPVVLIISAVLADGKRLFDSVIFSIGAYAVGIALIISICYLLTGTDIITYVIAQLKAIASSDPPATQQLLLLVNMQEIALGLVSQEALLALPQAQAVNLLIDFIKEAIYIYVPIIFSAYCILGGFLSFLITRSWAKKSGVMLLGVPEFSKMRLPKEATVGLAIALAAALLAGNLYPDIPNVTIACNILLSALVIIMAIVGLSFIDFLLKRAKMSKGMRIFFYILVALFMFTLLVIAGIVDQLVNLKKRMGEC